MNIFLHNCNCANLIRVQIFPFHHFKKFSAVHIFFNFRELWEKKPLLVKRHTPDYNKGWFSTAEFDKILRQVGNFFRIPP